MARMNEGAEALIDEFQFEAILEDLSRPALSSVDIENNINSLSAFGELSPRQAKKILDAVGKNITAWNCVSDTQLILELVTPPFIVYNNHVFSQSENLALQDEYTGLASKILTAIYRSAGDFEQDDLRELILKGQFGNATTLFTSIISSLLEEKSKLLETSEKTGDTLYGLWLDLLDANVDDHRLKELTERVIELDQYWRDDSVVYTCIESLERLEMGIGEEEQFVAKYSGHIARTLRANLTDETGELQEVRRRIGEKGLDDEQKKRVARFLRELRRNEIESKQELHRDIRDTLLTAVL